MDTDTPENIKCPYCGASNAADSGFCEVCYKDPRLQAGARPKARSGVTPDFAPLDPPGSEDTQSAPAAPARPMRSGTLAVFAVCAALYAASLCFVHRLPSRSEILPELLQDPVQVETSEPPFNVTRKDITYTITPRYTYEMYGLIVTYNFSDSWLDISHSDWKDYLNVMDISTIWGYNLAAGDYKKPHYYHADWTGYYEYRTPVDFHSREFANSHLLADNPEVEREMLRSEIGDQIRAKGYLVNYSHSGGRFTRNTSVTRDDRGNGACEIIFVTDYEILRKGSTVWRAINKLSKLAGGTCLLYLCYGFLFA